MLIQNNYRPQGVSENSERKFDPKNHCNMKSIIELIFNTDFDAAKQMIISSDLKLFDPCCSECLNQEKEGQNFQQG